MRFLNLALVFQACVQVVPLLGKDSSITESLEVAALSEACRFGDSQEVEFLIQNGADVNGEAGMDENGGFPLFPISYAIKGRKIDNIRLLIQEGATRGISDGLRHSGSDLEITKLLLENGADPNLVVGPGGETALFAATYRDEIDIARILLDNGADLRPTIWGRTPLDLALEGRSRSIVNVFVEAGHLKNFPISSHLPVWLHHDLLFGGAVDVSGIAMNALDGLLTPIRAFQSAVSSLPQVSPMRALRAEFPALDQDRTPVTTLVGFAFQASKRGIDLLTDAELRDNFVPAWSDERLRLVSSIISQLTNMGCSDINFYYSVAPFLAREEEAMLRRTETAIQFLAGAYSNSMVERQANRHASADVINEMIERSNRIGFRPVVKALYSIHHEERQIKRSFRPWGFARGGDPSNVQDLPLDIVDLVLNVEHGPFNPAFKAKAMRKLIQAMRRIQA